MALAELLRVALVLVGQLFILLVAIVVIACWPMWALWGSAMGFRAVLSRVHRVGHAVAFPLAWIGVLGLELVFLDRLLAGWRQAGGEVFLAALAVAHVSLCTPWAAVDYARA